MKAPRICPRCDIGVLSERMRMVSRCPNPKCRNHPGSPVEAAHPTNNRGMRRTFEAVAHNWEPGETTWHWAEVR